MADLTEDQQLFLVERLACYDGPARIARDFAEAFGVQITPQQVFQYDPSKPSNAGRVSEKLRVVFDAAREAFRKRAADHAISDVGYRVGRLQRMSERAEARGNDQLAADLLEQAAKDLCGAFTNKRQVEPVGPAVDALAALLGVDPSALPGGSDAQP